jgi:ribonuclease BN (tRNA processing enzyme)
VKLRFVGCGDAFVSGGRFNTCLHLDGLPGSDNGQGSILLDCGATSLVALKKWGIDPQTIGWVALSHLHGDHHGGIPWLLLDGRFAHREQPLVVAGPEGTEARVHDTLEALYPAAPGADLPFEVRYEELTEGRRHELGPATVTPFEVIHQSEVLSDQSLVSFGLRVECGGRVIAYSGDTEWTDNLIGLAAGADVFVCECNSWQERIPGHLDYATLLARRDELDCRRLIITHMGPGMLAHRDEVELEAAVDGMIVDV